MTRRYAAKPDEGGWTVIDTWLDSPAVVDGQPLTGLQFARAEIIASLLNRRAAGEGLKVRD